MSVLVAPENDMEQGDIWEVVRRMGTQIKDLNETVTNYREENKVLQKSVRDLQDIVGRNVQEKNQLKESMQHYQAEVDDLNMENARLIDDRASMLEFIARVTKTNVDFLKGMNSRQLHTFLAERSKDKPNLLKRLREKIKQFFGLEEPSYGVN